MAALKGWRKGMKPLTGRFPTVSTNKLDGVLRLSFRNTCSWGGLFLFKLFSVDGAFPQKHECDSLVEAGGTGKHVTQL